MNLEQAIEYFTENCPTLFAPIGKEIERLGTENTNLKRDLEGTQKAMNEVIFNLMAGGLK